MILVSRGSAGPLCGPLSILQVCMVCSLHPHAVDPGGDTCSLTAVGLLRTTVHGPFQCGAKELCVQSLTTPDPRAQIRESAPQGGMAPFLAQT